MQVNPKYFDFKKEGGVHKLLFCMREGPWDITQGDTNTAQFGNI